MINPALVPCTVRSWDELSSLEHGFVHVQASMDLVYCVVIVHVRVYVCLYASMFGLTV